MRVEFKAPVHTREHGINNRHDRLLETDYNNKIENNIWDTPP